MSQTLENNRIENKSCSWVRNRMSPKQLAPGPAVGKQASQTSEEQPSTGGVAAPGPQLLGTCPRERVKLEQDLARSPPAIHLTAQQAGPRATVALLSRTEEVRRSLKNNRIKKRNKLSIKPENPNQKHNLRNWHSQSHPRRYRIYGMIAKKESSKDQSS